MSAVYTTARHDVEAENEWTVMVFFAGDQDLSPAMTSQLKAIKDAGFQKNTTVLIHYDPNKRGVGTATFNINQKRKAELIEEIQKGNTAEPATRIGDGKDPFVRNLSEDIIDGAPKGATAAEALKTFLEMGGQRYPAKHYMIILVGHGVIVGNDAFLPDRSPSPDTAITLRQLGKILSGFQACVDFHGSTVDLVGLHSCSMSALEVVYELKDTAKYLLATEGTSFVGSWPYRQMLKKILNTIDEAKRHKNDVPIEQLIMSVQKLCLHNSTDFMFSGLSADLCLCSLQSEKVEELNAPLKKLTRALKEGLKSARGKELILLAHLESQSYWQENYTDLYDFCLCLERKCLQDDVIHANMAAACKELRGKLRETNHPDGLVVRSDFFGPLYQYSHGLSVYFPWAQPVQDSPTLPGDDIMLRYKDYKFTKELGDDSWLSFLEEYFKATRRQKREIEDNPKLAENGVKAGAVAGNGAKTSMPAVATFVSSSGGVVDALTGKTSPDLGRTSPDLGRTSPDLETASQFGCGCTVKNYPMEFMVSPRAAEDANKGTNRSKG